MASPKNPIRTGGRELYRVLREVFTPTYNRELRALQARLRELWPLILAERKQGRVNGPALRQANALIRSWYERLDRQIQTVPVIQAVGPAMLLQAQRSHRVAAQQLDRIGISVIGPLDRTIITEKAAIEAAQLASVMREAFRNAAKVFSDQAIEGVPISVLNERAGRLIRSYDVKQRFIARNIAGDVSAVITRDAYLGVGIRKFRWVSQEDERVRPAHVDLNGRVFDVVKGAPVEGFPGHPFG